MLNFIYKNRFVIYKIIIIDIFFFSEKEQLMTIIPDFKECYLWYWVGYLLYFLVFYFTIFVDTIRYISFLFLCCGFFFGIFCYIYYIIEIW